MKASSWDTVSSGVRAAMKSVRVQSEAAAAFIACPAINALQLHLSCPAWFSSAAKVVDPRRVEITSGNASPVSTG